MQMVLMRPTRLYNYNVGCGSSISIMFRTIAVVTTSEAQEASRSVPIDSMLQYNSNPTDGSESAELCAVPMKCLTFALAVRAH